VEFYYERLLKLVNSLQHKITYSLLTIIFRSGLQTYFSITTIGMKRETFQQHKETTLVCEERISKVEAIVVCEYHKVVRQYQLRNLRQF